MELGALFSIICIIIALTFFFIRSTCDRHTYTAFGCICIIIIFGFIMLMPLAYSDATAISDNINDISFKTAEKQQISEFVMKNDGPYVSLIDGSTYKLSNSWNCNDTSVYVMVNTDSASNCFISSDESVRVYGLGPIYCSYELGTNILFVDQETYDKLFLIKSVDLDK